MANHTTMHDIVAVAATLHNAQRVEGRRNRRVAYLAVRPFVRSFAHTIRLLRAARIARASAALIRLFARLLTHSLIPELMGKRSMSKN